MIHKTKGEHPMTLRLLSWRLFAVPFVVIVATLGMMVVSVTPLAAESQAATKRPIEEFVEAQGTYCFDPSDGTCLQFVPPLENFLGAYDPAADLSASIDYAGIAAAWLETKGSPSLGTSFSGSVIERPLRDGRAEIHVGLHTQHALTWVVEGQDFANGALIFGARPTCYPAQCLHCVIQRLRSVL
jgi:hypothetical protein